MTALDQATDAELAAKALGGEGRAFTQLMRRHKDGLYRFVRRYVGDADTAYEVVQEAFVAAWSNLARYDRVRPFGTWIKTIALNKCRDRARREMVRRLVFGSRPDDETLLPEAPDETPGAEEQLIAAQRRAALDRAIAALPVKLKEPLILTVFEEMPQQQAAEILGVTIKTIETRVYRARRALAASLGMAAESDPDAEG